MSPAALRVVTFQAIGSDSAFAAALRTDVLPDLVGRPEVLDAWQGRRGGGDGSHVLVSTWRNRWPGDLREAPDVALLRRSLSPYGGLEIASIDQLDVAVRARFGRPEPARVLRVFHGAARPGELADYVDEARAGMTEDAQINDGLVSFVLAHDGVERFVSVSTWTSWSAIESATGSNTRHPFATRNTRRLADFRIVHLELLPEAPVPAAAQPDAPALDQALEPAG